MHCRDVTPSEDDGSGCPPKVPTITMGSRRTQESGRWDGLMLLLSHCYNGPLSYGPRIISAYTSNSPYLLQNILGFFITIVTGYEGTFPL